MQGFWTFLAYNLAPCFIKMNYNLLKSINLRFSADPKYLLLCKSMAINQKTAVLEKITRKLSASFQSSKCFNHSAHHLRNGKLF
jgi:hypothetical protein